MSIFDNRNDRRRTLISRFSKSMSSQGGGGAGDNLSYILLETIDILLQENGDTLILDNQ